MKGSSKHRATLAALGLGVMGGGGAAANVELCLLLRGLKPGGGVGKAAEATRGGGD